MCSGNMSVTRKPRLVGNALCGDDIRHGNIELRHLRYFVAVAEELNFHRAASRLSITQLPLTKQIAGLDEQVGVSLFARERQRIVGLTSAGAEFLSEARRILDQVEDASAACSASRWGAWADYGSG